MDDRRRLAVPAKVMSAFRELSQADATQNVEVVVCITPRERVGVFPKPVFDELISDMEEAARTDYEIEQLLLSYLQHMDEQSLDKQNRFRIPPSLAEVFGLQGEVMVLGSGTFFEVVTKSEWRDQVRKDAAAMRQGATKLADYRRRTKEAAANE